jgi:hypothetical protein
MAEVIERLKPYQLGWKAYFGLAQTPGVWRALDEWLRHRLRAIQLKYWRRGSTILGIDQLRRSRSFGKACGAELALLVAE